MVNRDLRKREKLERKNPPRRRQSDLPASAQVVHSSETDDAPHKEIHEAYTDENIEKLKENSSPSGEGEELNRDASRVKRSGSSGEDDSSAA